MNEKKAKRLRREAGYHNQSSTPGTMPFPGVKRFYAHPSYPMHAVTKTSYEPCWLVEEGRWGIYKARRQVTKVKLNARGKAEPQLEYIPEHIDPETATVTAEYIRPKTAMVPVTKPAVLNDREPKGIYRGLKRIEKRWGLDNFVATMRGMTARQVAAPFLNAVEKARLAVQQTGVAPLEPRQVVKGIVNAGTD